MIKIYDKLKGVTHCFVWGRGALTVWGRGLKTGGVLRVLEGCKISLPVDIS